MKNYMLRIFSKPRIVKPAFPAVFVNLFTGKNLVKINSLNWQNYRIFVLHTYLYKNTGVLKRAFIPAKLINLIKLSYVHISNTSIKKAYHLG